MMREIFNLKEATTDSVQNMQMKMLEILLYFKSFCEKHNLLFYFCGGCLIGAVRHKGFIPWDDDIDCFMPREDYEKFAILWEQYGDKKKYTYCRTDKKHNYHHCGASLRDNNTTFINSHSKNEDICHGIGVEFLPIDGCPNSKFKRYKQLFYATIFNLFNAQRLPNNKGKLVRAMAWILFHIIPSKNVQFRIWRYAEKQMSKYKWNDCNTVTELIGSIRGMLMKHPKEWFDHADYLEFEGYKMPAMAGYRQYLELIWGDYMQLPPLKDRIAKHDVVYINLEKPYKSFKGVYYCVEK